MEENPEMNYIIIPKAKNFIDDYASAVQVLITNDGLIALEILKPDLNLTITEDNRTTYTGQWVSLARIIISPETARRLRDELNNVLKMYEAGGGENGETE